MGDWPPAESITHLKEKSYLTSRKALHNFLRDFHGIPYISNENFMIGSYIILVRFLYQLF